MSTFHANPNRLTSSARRRGYRGASVVVELLIAFPILFIALLVVVEFGVMMANLKQVAAATRDGARLAAQTAGLAPATTAATAAAVRALVDNRLESAGYGANASQGVTLRHTVAGGGVATDGVCNDPLIPALPAVDAVRVTVRVELTKFTPNLLASFGFDLSTRFSEHTATFEYEP